MNERMNTMIPSLLTKKGLCVDEEYTDFSSFSSFLLFSSLLLPLLTILTQHITATKLHSPFIIPPHPQSAPTILKTPTMPRPAKGPLDPPGRIANTMSQLLAKPHIATPILPLIGSERQFQRRPMLKDGEGDERFEVGVLRYRCTQGPGIG
jgi:hypothetical protein